jgi:hypothetical protein
VLRLKFSKANAATGLCLILISWVATFALLSSPPDPSPLIPTFQDQAAKAGITTVMVSGDPKEKKYLLESVGGGLAVLDYNNDGWMDLYLVNGGTLETARSGRGSRYPGALYRNNRDGTFTDVALAAGVRNSEWGKGALAADFNNDGIIGKLANQFKKELFLPVLQEAID